MAFDNTITRPSTQPQDVSDQQVEDDLRRPVRLQAPSQLPSPDRVIRNPLHEPESLFQLDQSSKQHFIGESTCTAFGSRMLQCLQLTSVNAIMSPECRYVQHPTFSRQVRELNSCKLPGRIRANLLVRVAIRFIGQDYHFFLQSDFLQQLDKVYSLRDIKEVDPVWACKFFVVLALGELYSTTAPTPSNGHAVPGTDYFLTAVGLLQDAFEEPSTTQVENMLLFVSASLMLSSFTGA